jgi:hypothetical protein
MNCPTCNRIIPKVGWCSHIIGEYMVRYDHDIDFDIKTIVWKSSDDPAWDRPLITLPGIVKLDTDRIEKLLVLQ